MRDAGAKIVEWLRGSWVYENVARKPLWWVIGEARRRGVLPSIRDIRIELLLRRLSVKDRVYLKNARRQHGGRYRADGAKPLVSIVIPTYCRGDLLVARTLPAVLTQTYENIEVIVVGDHCVDNTCKLMENVKDKRVKFHDLRNRGNYPDDPYLRWMIAGYDPVVKGHELACGDWIAGIDDDDVMLPRHVETLVRYAMVNDFEIVFGKYRCEEKPGFWKTAGGPHFASGKMPFGPTSVPRSATMLRSYLAPIQMFRDCWRFSMPHDRLAWNRLARAGVRAGFVDDIVSEQPLRQNEAQRLPPRSEVPGLFAARGKRGLT